MLPVETAIPINELLRVELGHDDEALRPPTILLMVSGHSTERCFRRHYREVMLLP